MGCAKFSVTLTSWCFDVSSLFLQWTQIQRLLQCILKGETYPDVLFLHLCVYVCVCISQLVYMYMYILYIKHFIFTYNYAFIIQIIKMGEGFCFFLNRWRNLEDQKLDLIEFWCAFSLFLFFFFLKLHCSAMEDGFFLYIYI